MSIRLMTSVWSRSDLSSTQKLVLLAFADWANDDGYCWPSINQIAIKSSMTDRSVQRILRQLEDMQFIKREDVVGKGNRYWVMMPETECHPRQNVTPPLTLVHPTPDTVSPNTSITHQDTPKNIKRALPDYWHPANFDPQSKSAHIIAGWTPEEYQTALEHFVQHHRSKGSKFVDWQSAWGTWVLNSAKYKGHSNGKANRAGSNIQRGSSGDGFTAVLREVGSRDDAFQASGNDGGMQQAPRIGFSPTGRD